jgi:hypothetical protein
MGNAKVGHEAYDLPSSTRPAPQFTEHVGHEKRVQDDDNIRIDSIYRPRDPPPIDTKDRFRDSILHGRVIGDPEQDVVHPSETTAKDLIAAASRPEDINPGKLIKIRMRYLDTKVSLMRPNQFSQGIGYASVISASFRVDEHYPPSHYTFIPAARALRRFGSLPAPGSTYPKKTSASAYR